MSELTIIQKAEIALSFESVKAQAQQLVEESSRIVEITDKAGYQECHAARMKLREARINTEKAGKIAREDALDYQKTVIAKEKELIAIMEPEEKRLHELQKAVDEEAERQKKEKERIERERIAEINARFAAIKTLPLEAVNATAEAILEQIKEAELIDELSFPEDMQPAAKYEKRIAVAALRAAYDKRVAADKEQEQIRLDREKLAKLEAQQAEANAERERQAQAERDRQDAEARAQRQAEADKQAELQRQADADRAAEDARIREEQRIRQEKLDADAAALAADRAKVEKEKKEAARKARAAEIANASLVGAAAEALALLKHEGFGDHIATQKLESALSKHSQEKAA